MITPLRCLSVAVLGLALTGCGPATPAAPAGVTTVEPAPEQVRPAPGTTEPPEAITPPQ